MGIINKNRIKGCKVDENDYKCDVTIDGKESTIRGSAAEIGNFVAKSHISTFSKDIPRDLKRHLDLATNKNIQNELDDYEKLAIKRQMMDERAKNYPNEKLFLNKVKDEITSPSDIKRVKEIGNERIAKYSSEENKKNISP